MASTTLAFQLNTERLIQLTTLQKRRNRESISVDLFAKELLVQILDQESKKE
jgi:hypothetical protein